MRVILKRLVLALMVIILMFWGFVYFATPTPKNPTTVKQVEDKIRENLPLGSSRRKVEEWLKSQGIEYGYQEEPKYETSVQDAGLDPDSPMGLIQAIIRDTDRSLLIVGNICLHFFLNKDGKTVKHQVQWLGTGP